jgi:hypothetical protein
VERFLSGAYFWKEGRALLGARGKLAPGRAKDLSVDDLEALARVLHGWNGRALGGGKGRGNGNNSSYIRSAGVMLEYSFILGRARDPFAAGAAAASRIEEEGNNVEDAGGGTEDDNQGEEEDVSTVVGRACLRLARDFTVGITEAMDSFLVLVALENGCEQSSNCVHFDHFSFIPFIHSFIHSFILIIYFDHFSSAQQQGPWSTRARATRTRT